MSHAFTKDAIPTQLSALLTLYRYELGIWQQLAGDDNEPQQVAAGNVYALEAAINLFAVIRENPTIAPQEITRLSDLLWQWKGELTEEPYQLARIDALEMMIEDLKHLESFE